MAGVLILGLICAGEVLARRNIGTGPLPDFIRFQRKCFLSEGTCFVSTKKNRPNPGSIPKLRVPFVCRLRRSLFHFTLLLNIATLCVVCLVYC